jgi:hypothetical protein
MTARTGTDTDLPIPSEKPKTVGRAGVDAWIERFLRRDAMMANPESTMGGQLDRLLRSQTDNAGNQFVRQKPRPIYGGAVCEACGGIGDGCQACNGRGRLGELIGEQQVEYVTCKDDSAAHNAAHRMDARFADHGVDLLVWSSLKPIQRGIILAQREPVRCPGGIRPPRRQRTIDKTTCEHERVRPSAEHKTIGHCDTCAATFELNGAGKVTAMLVCRVCGLQERVENGRNRKGQWQPLIGEHVRRVRIRVERRLSARRDGDGSELIRPMEVDEDGYCAM